MFKSLARENTNKGKMFQRDGRMRIKINFCIRELYSIGVIYSKKLCAAGPQERESSRSAVSMKRLTEATI